MIFFLSFLHAPSQKLPSTSTSSVSRVCRLRYQNAWLRPRSKISWAGRLFIRVAQNDNRERWSIMNCEESASGEEGNVLIGEEKVGLEKSSPATNNEDVVDWETVDVSDENDDQMDQGGMTLETDSDDELFSETSPLVSQSLLEYWEQREEGSLIPSIERVNESKCEFMWAASVPKNKFRELQNMYAVLGVQIAHNFPDFVPGEYTKAVEEMPLEDQASYKASCVYRATGMPAIAEATEFEIEPSAEGGQLGRTRDIIQTAAAMIERAKPISYPERVTRFRTVVVFYDGMYEVAKESAVDVAIYFSEVGRASICLAGALDALYEDLSARFRLHVANLDEDEDDAREPPKRVLMGATHLRKKILCEAEVLGTSLLKVSSFLNHQVDAVLMDECGEELAERLRSSCPTKILAAESSGLLPSLSMARFLRIPVVFARRTRLLSACDSYQVSYRSATKGELCELIVSTEYLNSEDRILICDDFLARGSTVEALAKLCRMAGARLVGFGALIEKVAGGGRNFLAAYGVPVESLAKVSISDNGTIEVAPEPLIEV